MPCFAMAPKGVFCYIQPSYILCFPLNFKLFEKHFIKFPFWIQQPGMEGRNCYADEHYFPTLFRVSTLNFYYFITSILYLVANLLLYHFSQMVDPGGIANWSVTYVDWSERKWHPKSYKSPDVTSKLLRNITVHIKSRILIKLLFCDHDVMDSSHGNSHFEWLHFPTSQNHGTWVAIFSSNTPFVPKLNVQNGKAHNFRNVQLMTILPLILEGVMNFSISKLRAELESRHLLLKVDTYLWTN